MASVSSAMFQFLEAPVTAFAGIYAMATPIPFITALVAPRLLHTVSSIKGEASDALSFAVQLYGLVLVLLAVAEFLIFRVRGQVQSKRALLIAMLLADVLHIGAFSRAWFFDATGSMLPNIEQHVQGWGNREWVAFSTNIPLIVLFILLRVLYMATAQEGPQSWDLGRSHNKHSKQW